MLVFDATSQKIKLLLFAFLSDLLFLLFNLIFLIRNASYPTELIIWITEIHLSLEILLSGGAW